MTPEDRKKMEAWDERYSGSTHYEGCEEDHARCFYRRLINKLEAENERLRIRNKRDNNPEGLYYEEEK